MLVQDYTASELIFTAVRTLQQMQTYQADVRIKTLLDIHPVKFNSSSTKPQEKESRQ